MKIYLKFFVWFNILFVTHIADGQSLEWSKKANPQNHQINSVAFNTTGAFLLSGTDCHPASIRMFKTSDGQLKWDYTVGESFMCIMGVTFSSNGKYIAAMEEFGNILVFDNSGSQPVLIDTVVTGSQYRYTTCISPDNSLLVVACSNGNIITYNLENRNIVKSWFAHFGGCTSVAFSNDASKIISGGIDNNVKIWNTSGSLVKSLTGHSADISQVAVSSDGISIFSASQDKTIKRWNLSDGSLVKTYSGHTLGINGVAVSPDNAYFVSASADHTCKIWEINSGNNLKTFGIADSGAYKAVAWSPDGKWIATGNENSDVNLWKIEGYLHTNPTVNNSKIEFHFDHQTSTLNIQENLIQNATLNIYNMQGQILKNCKITDTIMPLTDLSTGMYVLIIEWNGDQKSIRISIE